MMYGGAMMTRSQNKQQQLEQAKDIVINSIGQTMDLYGTNRSVGNLYGTMVFEGSMTLDEMRHQLQMSKPSMSAGVKILLNNNLREEAANNILSPRKTFSSFSETFSLKNSSVKLTSMSKQ